MHRFDARSVRSWSGTFHFMAKALQAHVGDVVYLGPDKSLATKFIIDNTARANRFWFRLTRKVLITDHNRILSHRLARFFLARMAAEHCDILFAPAASVEIASLKTSLPIVYSSDTTWADVVNYYPEFSSLSSLSRHEGEWIEAAAIRRADAIAYPSEWAARSAREHYKADPAKIHRLPFGANLESVPSREAALRHPLNGRIQLLMIGVDWERKGGAIALECLKTLLDNGVDAHLTLCGCVPPPGFEHPRMHVIPFLNKNQPEDRLNISRLFLDAHFLLLPTRAEAMGIVTCEASAHGLPALVTDTGGTRGALNPGINGFLLPLDARGDAYAEKILDIVATPTRYAALVASSRDEFERSLNWDTWGRSMHSLMEQILNRKIERPEFSESVSAIALDEPDSDESISTLTVAHT
ncbi:glycosyltransferase family 4 protein [Acidicapsa ligni]|uniref:glycosyltransferase family 4 protein n=1 Tax=Acidicapsa ligni TaxID=542300 RepID=UPI0021DFA076|nr:glycosyltransferase family 4 protein [Acidicapsa ligni]